MKIKLDDVTQSALATRDPAVLDTILTSWVAAHAALPRSHRQSRLKLASMIRSLKRRLRRSMALKVTYTSTLVSPGPLWEPPQPPSLDANATKSITVIELPRRAKNAPREIAIPRWLARKNRR